ncbi:MAG: TetR/AcrR family transcriptional regulator [Sulfurovum sp.]|jgi:AcrR family transcriptional regulator|nr:TetR/AcrR family transcriptional regulator [Sulfurovum sp.]
MPRLTTKKKILAAALKLFNGKNTQAATTNHIAAALGMSSGNLHYHFKNREAIVFALYEQMLSKTMLEHIDFPVTITQMHEHQLYLAKIYWEYRFFNRELLFLLSRDPELKARYIKENIGHKRHIRIVFEQLAANGYLDIPEDHVYTQLVDTVLLCNQFWHSHLETLGSEVDEANLAGGFGHIEEAMRPYLTAKALDELGTIKI